VRWAALVLGCGLLSGCVDIEIVDVDIRIGWFVRLSDESGTWEVVEGPVRRSELSGERGSGSTVLLGYRAEELPGIDDPSELVGQLRVPRTCERTLPAPAWRSVGEESPVSFRLAVGEEWKPCWDTWGCDPKRCNTDIVKVSTGEAHACGLDSSGTAYCWARTNTPMTGRDPDASEFDFEVSRQVNDIAAGAQHACRSRPDGETASTSRVHCWGATNKGQTGYHYVATDLRSKSYVFGDYGLSLLDLEADHGCALAWKAEVRCWGEGYDFSIATVVSYFPRPDPKPLSITAFDIGTGLVCMINNLNARCAPYYAEYWDDTEPFAYDVEHLAAYGSRACATGESWVRCYDFESRLATFFEMPNDAKPRDLDLSDAGWCVVFDDGQLHCEHPSLTTDRLPADIRVRPYPGSISLSKDKAACLILSDQSVRCTGTTTSTIVPLPRPN
jgi:hypothetical protein